MAGSVGNIKGKATCCSHKTDGMYISFIIILEYMLKQLSSEKFCK